VKDKVRAGSRKKSVRVSKTKTAKPKKMTLLSIMKKEEEVAKFFRFVQRNRLRKQALKRLNAHLSDA
jgi:hypothetical protein